MSKLSGLVGLVAAALLSGAPAAAAPLASHVGGCGASAVPAMLVQVTGFKDRHGMLRIQSYGGDRQSFFEKGAYIDRIDVPVPASGPARVCVPVGRTGEYAVSVRHDMDGDRKTGRADGGGMSGNPHVSVGDLVFKRKPPAERVVISVGRGVTTVPVILNYMQGMSFRPISGR
ncbi:DUF2141 domain-containing protein [Sphingomonas prati]|uniref:Uncharacterized protein (DUF2141 family) n=1 Tax=Sphingomonas prati TaxID=1843237 RepID=A0A7W9F3A5_9SPHN|nr:DUF2141 domain-containing protein [Sphingomonas prati]MBB5729305.1 uncharacterized protein (DUF2141 family) [Sphingomonas prati]